MSGKYPWDKIRSVINDVIEHCYMKYGVEPSVRRILYRLRDLGLLPVTNQAYKALSRMLTKWREEGFIDWRKIRDARGERKLENLEPIEYFRDQPLTPEEIIEIVKSEIDWKFRVSINPWRDQPCRVIVFVEKEGEFHTVKKIIEDVWEFGVYAIHSGGGYDSCTWKFRLAEDVKRIVSEGARPVILSFGDLDPSGSDIDRDFVDKVRKYSGVNDIVWERVAVTRDQVDRYGLSGIFRTDEEYMRYMRDPRRKRFEERYGMIKVELSEFLEEVDVDEVKRIVRGAIEKYFDWEIYNTRTAERLRELRERAERAKEETLKNLERMLRGTN